MGEEHDERAPFQFFTDHIDPAIADATREGRKREFAAFTSLLRRGGARPAGRGDRRALGHLRTREAGSVLPRAAAAAAHAAARARRRGATAAVLTMRRGDRTLVADFDAKTVELAMRAVVARPAVPARPRRGTARARTSRSSRRTPSASSSASSTKTAARSAIEVTRAHRLQLALLPARRRPGPALRLPRARAVRPGDRQALQPGEAPDRPVREGDRRRRRLGRRERPAVRARGEDADLTSSTTPDSAPAIPKSIVIDPSFDWEDDDVVRPRRPWNETVIYEAHVKGFTKLRERRARGPARHVRRARERGCDRRT